MNVAAGESGGRRQAVLVSFNLASNRPQSFAELCANLEATASDPARLEVLVKIDDGDSAMHACVAAEAARRPFAIKALSTLGEGYFSLWKSLNRLHRELCDPAAIFVCNINDEIRFKTQAWDRVLVRWQAELDAEFPDGIYRLKTSVYKLRNYGDFWECGFAPENYAFYTRRWIDVAGGDWNACHGPDAFQQFIAYYLFWSTWPAKDQINRDVPIFDIAIEGEGAFLGLSTEQFWARVARGWVAWYILVSHAMQTEANRRARMLQAHVAAWAAGYRDFTIGDDPKTRHVYAAKPGTLEVLTGARGRPLRFPYRLSWLRITLTNWLRRPMQNYYGGGGPEIWRETFVNIPFFFFPTLHAKSRFRQSLKARLLHPWFRFAKVTANASDCVPHAPPALLIDRSADPWGSQETDADTYFWLTHPRRWKARRIDLLTFSPGERAHLADVRAVGRSRTANGEAGPWVAIPARIKGAGDAFTEKLTVPPIGDNERIAIELDRSVVRQGRFSDIGLACLSQSEGDRRNWLDVGRGIYVREMTVVE